MFLIRWYRQYCKFRQRMTDHKLNRELVGIDRYGNKYYQYFSYYGLPTKRQVEYIGRYRWQFFEDKAFYMWMRRWNVLPPTEEEVEQYYIDEQVRRKRAFEWDQKEMKLMEEYRQQRQILLQKQQEQLDKISQVQGSYLDGDDLVTYKLLNQTDQNFHDNQFQVQQWVVDQNKINIRKSSILSDNKINNIQNHNQQDTTINNQNHDNQNINQNL